MLDAPNDKTLMIVEDDDALRKSLASAMTRRGFDVSVAGSPSEAMTMTETATPKHAIVDLRLLDGSGLSFVEMLEERDPEVRAIILTGYGNIPTAVAAVRAGAIDYIAKPATADEIVDALLRPKDQQPPAPANPMSPDEARKEHIAHVFHDMEENVSQTARSLGMHRRTLQRLLKRYRIA